MSARNAFIASLAQEPFAQFRQEQLAAFGPDLDDISLHWLERAMIPLWGRRCLSLLPAAEAQAVDGARLMIARGVLSRLNEKRDFVIEALEPLGDPARSAEEKAGLADTLMVASAYMPLLFHAVHRDYERPYGLDLIGSHAPGGPGARLAQAAGGNPYEPCPPDLLRDGLNRLPLEPQQTRFVDLGCGKGLGLLVAAERPFAQMVGIELEPTLAQIARENLARYPQEKRACGDIAIVEGDALSAPWPEGDVVVYLFNTLTEPLMPLLRERLERIAQAGHRAWVVYIEPLHLSALEASPAARLLHKQINMALLAFSPSGERLH
ncbi:methyltransferase domain-containing protein [Magnetofaba australis]|uniref:Methyltransferase domain-containing protein n=1 Tax=Magnetofaba australis IT-1 TaxID=1434232 RepID=A0A1Y2K8C8_9PROT|nr:methyltransferase domain-containing protein [Magnetofaba australis]OSM06932.1 hypothetical protein MAIT1_00182 [Magnetofaba australis IT-1]